MKTTSQSLRMARRVSLLSFALGSLAACSNSNGSLSFDPAQSVHDVFIAATSPLDDLNLRRESIPPLLKKAAKNPYGMPMVVECAPIREEVAQLDALLGAEKELNDMSTLVSYKDEDGDDDSIVPKLPEMPDIPDGQTLVVKGSDVAHDQAIGFVRDQTSILPFRNLIRTISGAEQHARKVEKARQAGLMRRAFLKGIAQAKFGKACLSPPVAVEASAAAVMKAK